jgi:hypothetical protein
LALTSVAAATPAHWTLGFWDENLLFSASSIWRRRPLRASELPSYLAMSALYKRSNALWPVLIERALTGRAWRPWVEGARRRHLAFRRRLAQQSFRSGYLAPVYAGA